MAQTVGTLRRAIGRLNRFFLAGLSVIHGEAGMTREVAAYGLQMLHGTGLSACQLRLEGWSNSSFNDTLSGLLDHPFNL